MRYEVIYADPPWPEKGSGRVKRGADRHYPLMSVSEVKQLGKVVCEVAAPDALLFLWTTNRFLPDAIEVLKEWGFVYKTNIVWCKDRFGLGFYFRGQHELCLFGIRGRPPHSIQGSTRTGRFVPPSVIHARREKHSQKPVEVYAIIERFSDGPYLEMFARNRRPKWDSWGKDLERED